MADRDMKFTLKFLSDVAGLKEASQALDKLGDGFDDTEDSGKQLASAMSQVADKVEADMTAVASMADRLGQALGPELAAKIGRGGLEKLAIDLRNTGVPADQLEANIDDIANSVKRLDAATSSVDHLDGSMRRVGDTTDRTRSVTANFTGNALQEIPMMTGAFGPLNMAIGQFGEYAAEGNIKLMSLAGAGAGLAVASLAMNEIAKSAKRVAETKAFDAAQVKTFTEALKDGKSAASAYADELEKAGMVMAHTFAGGVGGRILDGTQDITDSLIRAGITLDVFSEAATGGAQGLADLDTVLRQAGVSGDDYQLIMSGATSTQENLAKAEETSAKFALLHADAIDNRLTPAYLNNLNATRDHFDELGRLNQQYEDAEGQIDGAAMALKREEDALHSLDDARRSALDSTFAAKDAADGYLTALDNLATAQDDGKTSVDEYQQSLDTAAQAALANADAQVELAAKNAEAAGKTMTAKEKQDLLIGSLQMMVSQLDPSSPLRQNLEQYLLYLGDIPANKTTVIDLYIPKPTGPGVAFMPGVGYGGATSKEGPQAKKLPPGTVLYGGADNNPNTPGDAQGTWNAQPGATLVGEHGQAEIVAMGGGERVLTGHETADVLNGHNGAPVYNITVIAGLGTDGALVGRQIVDAIQKADDDGYRRPWMGTAS